VVYKKEKREGDVLRAVAKRGFNGKVGYRKGLERTVKWYRETFIRSQKEMTK